MKEIKTSEKESSLSFKLNDEEISLEKDVILFIGWSKYRIDASDGKKVSDPYQKLFFARVALENCTGYNQQF